MSAPERSGHFRSNFILKTTGRGVAPVPERSVSMSVEPIAVDIDEEICFSCSDKLECFNKCCCDVDQFLYPYDIVRLKNSLNITSGEFLDKYAFIYSGDTTGLPVVSFLTKPSNEYACPLLTDKGCGVYADRPASCRMFPLARAISRSRETGEINEYFALIKDPICKGFESDRKISVKAWAEDQGLVAYNSNNDRMIQLISMKQQIMPGKLEGPQKDMFIMACYDVDRFRKNILEEGLVTPDEMGAELYENIKTDDEALINFGLSWIGSQLFGKRF